MVVTSKHQVLSTLKEFIPVNTMVRWARRSKVPELSLVGSITSIEWTDTHRNGGGFVFMILYKGVVYPHQECLLRMYNDYKAYIEFKVGSIDSGHLHHPPPPPHGPVPSTYTKAGNKRRRRVRSRRCRRLKVPVAANINSSRDLSFNIGDEWPTLGVLVPNKVRMLYSPNTEEWLVGMGHALRWRRAASPPTPSEIRVGYTPEPLPPLHSNFLESPVAQTSILAELPILSPSLDAIVGDPESWLDPDLDYLLDSFCEQIDLEEFDRYLTSTYSI